MADVVAKLPLRFLPNSDSVDLGQTLRDCSDDGSASAEQQFSANKRTGSPGQGSDVPCRLKSSYYGQ